jgi:hypothetical protein
LKYSRQKKLAKIGAFGSKQSQILIIALGFENRPKL